MTLRDECITDCDALMRQVGTVCEWAARNPSWVAAERETLARAADDLADLLAKLDGRRAA